MIRLVTWNLLFGGREDDGHGDDTRWRGQVELLRELNPDILMLQECNDWEARGQRKLHQAVNDLGMASGVLAEANPTTAGHRFHSAILISPRVQMRAHGADTTRYHHVAGWANIGIPGLDRDVETRNIQLDPFDGEHRLTEVKPFEVLAAPGRLAMVVGDGNCIPPNFPPEALNLAGVPAHLRGGWVLDPHADTPVADTRALAFLLAAGFVDAAESFGAADQLTSHDRRCDVVFVSPALAERLAGYRVVTDAGDLSDHFPVEALLADQPHAQ